ncbi:hypothetical protein Pmani_024097 [Petrolisthes manimaculis]|uniref:Uncharacterized protein n=1 Tax=Petrolisthes manimaculis TaxID=1843537 RepID=A0AAE1P9F0_9EUCA|nr:hypothetical protein Pmani_024097 [Petrolisthes manimaculis]
MRQRTTSWWASPPKRPTPSVRRAPVTSCNVSMCGNTRRTTTCATQPGTPGPTLSVRRASATSSSIYPSFPLYPPLDALSTLALPYPPLPPYPPLNPPLPTPKSSLTHPCLSAHP